MQRNFTRLIAALAVIAVLSNGPLLTRAQEQHPVFMAPGFQFDQIDALCVMPPIVAGDNPEHLDISGLRTILMGKVQDRGYRLLDPSCSSDFVLNATLSTKPRWVLTVKLDNFEVSRAAPNLGLGTYLTASLVDNQKAKEVWRDTGKTGYGGRLMRATFGGDVDDMVISGFRPVLNTFEKQKKPPPPSPATMWQPISFSTRLYKYHGFSECNGQLSFDSGTLSFIPSSNGGNDKKCESYRFSVQGAKFGMGMWLIVPKKGKFALQQEDAKLGYLVVALRNML